MRGGGFRGSFGGEDGTERFERMLRELDTNRNGRVEESEVDGRRRFFVEMMARRAGIEPRFPMSVSRLRDAMARRARENEDSSSGRSGGSGGPKPDPLVPDFGVELDLAPVLKFGERAPDQPSGGASSSPRSGPRGSSPSGGQADERVRRWAEAMMQQADRNRNGKLERDEWNERWGDFGQADRNRDGGVSPDELAGQLGNFSRRRPDQDRSNSGDRSSSDSSSGSGDSERPKSYRLLTPTERLPEKLPPWFAQKDANGDGQVAMAEFWAPGFWTNAAAAEFAGYDLNHDGMITAQECLAALAGGQVASTPPGGQVAQAGRAAPPSAQGPGRRGPGLLSRGGRRPGTPASTTPASRAPGRQPSRGTPGQPASDDPWAGWE